MNEKKNTKTLSTYLKKFLLIVLPLFCLHSLLVSWGDSEDSTRSIGEVEGVKRKAVTKQDSKSAESMQQLVEKKGLLIPREPDTIPANTISRIIKDTPDHYLSSCIPTSQFLIVPQEADGTLLLHSLDPSGRRKYKGGDEIYVTYRDQNNDSISPTAIARIEDLQNGSYKLDFVKSRSPKIDHKQTLAGLGSIVIHLHYTCFTSYLDPPAKNSWSESGAFNTKYTSGENTIVAPPMRDADMPKQFPELALYDKVYTLGNSLMGQHFYTNFKSSTASNKQTPRKPNFQHIGGMGGALNTGNTIKYRHIRSKIGVEEERGNTALILGSCVWDMMAHHSHKATSEEIDSATISVTSPKRWFEWDDHLEAVETLISDIRREFPSWKIYWKGCTAIQINAWTGTQFAAGGVADSVWYTSWIRSQKLDLLQKKLMEKLDVPVFDLWSLSFDMAELLKPGDTRHYQDIFYDFTLDYILNE